jgi:HSP20 family molecular chaperone IbpA
MRYRWIRYRYAEIMGEKGTQLLEELWSARSPALLSRPQWRPPVDYYETLDKLIVKAEIAGLSDEDFDITLYDDTLVIEGVRSWRLEEDAVRFHAVEIRYGPFRLEVPVVMAVDRERVSAKYELGFLYVSLPKAEGDRS